LLHPDPTAALAAEERRHCPCGAVAESAYGLCRKCHARTAWHRKVTRARRREARRLTGRRARTLVRLLAETLALISTGKGAVS
jgi:hypothetical protein